MSQLPDVDPPAPAAGGAGTAQPPGAGPSSAVGVVGLGFVGRAFAQRLVAAGVPVLGADPVAAAREAATAIGVQVGDSSTAAFDVRALVACCATLVVCVLDDAALLAVTDAIVDQATSGGRAPVLVVSAVTCGPAAADAASARIASLGADFVELPMSGSSTAIGQGTALALAGATEAAWARHAALLGVLAPTARRVGPPGSGARAKLATNLVLGLNRSALAEGLALADALGIDGDTFLSLLRASPAYSRAVDLSGPRMVSRDFTPVSRISQHRKDLRLMLGAAQDAGIDLPLTRAHASLLDTAIARGLGDADNVAVRAAYDPAPAGTDPAPAAKGS